MTGAKPVRIVIVGNDRQILNGLSTMLARGGPNFSHKPITCDNAFDALEVALACGFINERHFYKVFKKRLGLTPVSSGRNTARGNGLGGTAAAGHGGACGKQQER